MAYGEKYVLKWKAMHSHGFIIIYEKDYSGASAVPLELAKGSLVITRDFSDWSQHILGATCEFDILNNKSDFFGLFDLLLATEKKYLIKVSDFNSTTVLFEGFINTDVVQQKYLRYQSIRIVASSYLSKLEYTNASFVEDISPITFIDMLNKCLVNTGIESDLYVEMSLQSDDDTLTATQTTLNSTGMYPELFWKNNEERKTDLEIVNTILNTFNLYLYWWDSNWYLLDYYSFWKTSHSFVKYDYNTSYNPSDEGDLVTETRIVKDLHSLVFAELTQTISVSPGNKINQVNLELAKFDNLVSPDFRNPVTVTTVVPEPALRNWSHFREYNVFSWEDINEPYLTMLHSKKRIRTTSINDLSDYARGTYLTFDAKVEENTTLNIKWKWNDADFYRNNSGLWGDDWLLRFRYYLHIISDDQTGTPSYIWYDAANDVWKLNNWAANPPYHDESNVIDVTINKEEAKKGSYVYDVQQSIPLSRVLDPSNEIRGSFRIVFGILTASYVWPNHTDIVPPTIYIGDVEVSLSGNEEPYNLLEGEINTDYLNKDSIDLSIFDCNNTNYRNGIMRACTGCNEVLGDYTDKWLSPIAVPAQSIAKIRLLQLVRETNVARQRITGDVMESDVPNVLLRPLSLFTDSQQSNKKFVLMGYRHLVDIGKYQIDLREYDNSTTINIIS